MKKAKGSYADGLISLIFIIALLIVVQEFVYMFKTLEVKEEIRQYARSCMLEMETIGYLSTESKSKLLQNLSDLQVTEVDLGGTTVTNVGYGNEIHLCIHCKIPMNKLNPSGNNFFSFSFGEERVDVSVTMMSTAKN